MMARDQRAGISWGSVDVAPPSTRHFGMKYRVAPDPGTALMALLP